MPDNAPRQLTPPSANGHPWRLAGDSAHCAFCGSGNIEATLGAPVDISVCRYCLVNCILTRLQYQTIVQRAHDTLQAKKRVIGHDFASTPPAV
jgi:hypothetical protein